MTPIKFNFDEIPNIEKRILFSRFLKRIKIFYEDPENVRRFEEWKKKREEDKEKRHA